MWREKEFWPKHSQPHPPPFLIIPRLLVVVTTTINEQKKMILFTITNTFAAKLFATKLSIMSCLFSHSLLNILAHLPPQYNCFEKCRGSWKNWRPGICYSNPIPVLIPVCEIANSGMGRELKKSIPTIREREGNEKNPFPQFGNGKGMKNIHSHNSGMGISGYHSQEFLGMGTGMKKT